MQILCKRRLTLYSIRNIAKYTMRDTATTSFIRDNLKILLVVQWISKKAIQNPILHFVFKFVILHRQACLSWDNSLNVCTIFFISSLSCVLGYEVPTYFELCTFGTALFSLFNEQKKVERRLNMRHSYWLAALVATMGWRMETNVAGMLMKTSDSSHLAGVRFSRYPLYAGLLSEVVRLF